MLDDKPETKQQTEAEIKDRDKSTKSGGEMTEHIRTVKTAEEKAQGVAWASAIIDRGLPGGAVDIIVARHDPERSNPQNSRSHAMNAGKEIRTPEDVVLALFDKLKIKLPLWQINYVGY